MKIKYVEYELPTGNKEFTPWNTITFYGCKVLNINTVDYKAGRRMTIEIEAPKLRKKYYLYAWSDAGACEAYRIIANPSYDSKYPENERFFKFMVIKREIKKNVQAQKAAYMSKNDLLKKMLG